MVFPVLWAIYTIIRGRMVNWYPYFFLNPDLVGGYAAVGIYALGLSVFILLVALATVAVTRLPAIRAPAADSPWRADNPPGGGAPGEHAQPQRRQRPTSSDIANDNRSPGRLP